MDNTMVGSSEAQVCRYEIAKFSKQKHDVKKLMADLDNGLLRPYFESFVKFITTKHNNVELYVFTAAETKWAHVMINAIERQLNIKFNRPIFPREYCTNENGVLKKNIAKLMPIIYRKLKSKYRLTHISQLKKQIVLIDNSMVIGANDAHRFVMCPSYYHSVPCNVLEGIPENVIRDHMSTVVTVLQKYGFMTGVSVSSLDVCKFLSLYYAWLAELYHANASQINRNRKDLDTFWFRMEKIFRNHHIKSFSGKVVTYINKNVT